jgi:glucosamine-6-phosphate deaminase
MDVIVVAPHELDRRGAALVADWLGPRPRGMLMPALGTSALGLYRELAAMRRDGRLDTSALSLAQLDEYTGLVPDDPRTLRGWLERDVAEPLAIPADRIIGLPSDADDPEAACRTYAAAVAAAGGVDVAVLGLGPNGHLGFNEPPSGPKAPTRPVELTDASLASNARYWGGREAVPTHALTAGMDVILAARRSVLVVAGPAKRDIVRRLVTEDPGDELPASHLRGIHGAVLLADTEAWPPDIDIPATLSP